jgi:hypothetical protein
MIWKRARKARYYSADSRQEIVVYVEWYPEELTIHYES